MSAHTNYTHALTQASRRRVLETIAESFRLSRCKTTQDPACPPHILPQANVSPLLDLDAYTATVYTTSSLTLYQTRHKRQSLCLDQAV